MLTEPFQSTNGDGRLSGFTEDICFDSLDIGFSTLGSALERLAYATLVLDQGDEELRQNLQLLFDPRAKSQTRKVWGRKTTFSVKCLQLLLEKIGLTQDRGHNDINQTETFVFLRNDAVHLELTDIPRSEASRMFNLALQWFEEAFLWQLGYEGSYADRTGDLRTSTITRYDLSSRDLKWDKP